jgi:ribosome-associated protein
MTKKSSKNPILSTVDLVVKGIQEKKGSKIAIVDLRKVLNAYSDYFIICTGSSDTNVRAICDSVEEILLTTLKEKPLHIEGYQEANWVLLDYFDTIVHVFKEQEREHFNLENLWADAEITHVPEQ